MTSDILNKYKLIENKEFSVENHFCVGNAQVADLSLDFPADEEIFISKNPLV